MENLFFNSWDSLLRIVISTIMAYLAMVFFLRITGKRTLSKMNAFDFVITVALGSSLATVVLNKNVPILNGAVAFFMLIGLQLLITWLSVRNPAIKKMVTSRPTLLLYKGEIFEDIIRKERITREELFVAARSKGIPRLSDLDAIVLETTGDITIIPQLPSQRTETMSDVEYYNKENAKIEGY